MFLSLRWKAVILCLVLLGGLGFLSIIQSNAQLNQLFNSQKIKSAENHKREIQSLLDQSFQHLLQMSDLFSGRGPFEEGGDSPDSKISQQWDYLQLNLAVESASLFDKNAAIKQQWGTNPPAELKEVYKTARSGLPSQSIKCFSHCSQLITSPLITNNGEFKVLQLSVSLADTLLAFKRFTSANIGILSSLENNSDNAKQLKHWNLQIEALTGIEQSSKLLRLLEQRATLTQLLNDPLTLSSEGRTYVFIAKPIDQSMERSSKFVIIEDVTDQFNIIQQSRRAQILASLAGIGGCCLLIILLVMRPIRRLKEQAELLPLLTRGQYDLVRERLENNSNKILFKDEIDILDAAEVLVSKQLSEMKSTITDHSNTLDKMARFDELTGLHNRQYIIQAINEKLSSDKSDRNYCFTVLFIDLDDFKRVNDSMSHSIGDQLLCVVAERIRLCTQYTDIAARLGGDEFCVVLGARSKPNDSLTIASAILSTIRAPIEICDQHFVVSASIGVAHAPTDGESADELVKNAEAAMYRGKSSGTNNYTVFDPAISEEALARIQLENELQVALVNREFVLHFQPQIDLRTDTIFGVEALLRWKHPTKGLRPPFEFIPILEETGLIVPVGDWVVQEACRTAKGWDALGLPKIRVAVNLSARQFKDNDLVASVKQSLKSLNFPAERLELEITESTIMDDIEVSRETLNQLRELGIELSIDDFGTGHSSLNYLKTLPLNTLKIDRSFVDDITNTHRETEIASAIIAMAHKLRLGVIAEGIENLEQEEFLKQNDCEFGQGFYYSKPITREEIIALLTKKSAEHKNS